MARGTGDPAEYRPGGDEIEGTVHPQARNVDVTGDVEPDRELQDAENREKDTHRHEAADQNIQPVPRPDAVRRYQGHAGPGHQEQQTTVSGAQLLGNDIRAQRAGRIAAQHHRS